MTEPRDVDFAVLDEDTRQLVRTQLASYLAARNKEKDAQADKEEANGAILVVWQSEKALRGSRVRVPDPATPKNEKPTVIWVLQVGTSNAQVSVEKFRQNLLDAGIDPDIVSIAWGAAMSGGGKKFIRVSAGGRG